MSGAAADAEMDPVLRRDKFLAQMKAPSLKSMREAPLAADPRPRRPGRIGLRRSNSLQDLASPFAALNANANTSPSATWRALCRLFWLCSLPHPSSTLCLPARCWPVRLAPDASPAPPAATRRPKRRVGEEERVVASLKAIARLKTVLRRRFSNAYEAFTYCDEAGRGRLTANELTAVLWKLDIASSDIIEAAWFFGRQSADGTIDSTEFVRILAWHDVHQDIGPQLQALRPRREGIAAKAWGLTQAEQVFASFEPPWITKSSAKMTRKKAPSDGKGLRPSTAHPRLARGTSQPVLRRQISWTGSDASRAAHAEAAISRTGSAISRTGSAISRTGSAFSRTASGISNVGTALSRTSSGHTADNTNVHGLTRPDTSAGLASASPDAGQPPIIASHDSNAPLDILHIQGGKGGDKSTKNSLRIQKPSSSGSKNKRQTALANQSLYKQVDFSWRKMPPSFFYHQQAHQRQEFLDKEQHRDRAERWAGNTPFSALAPSGSPAILRKGPQSDRPRNRFLGDSNLDNNLSQQAKRKRLFYLFQKYDEDDSGSLEAGEVKVLLSDMGHDYEEEEIQKALSLVAPQVPGKVDAGIEFQDFCEWWECLDWFHQQGIYKGALSMASAKYNKGAWLETLDGVKDDLHTVIAKQESDTSDNERWFKWYYQRYPEEDPEVQTPGTFREGPEKLTTANHFFEFTQKEISHRVKWEGVLFVKKKRNAAAEMLAASSRNKPKKKPQKYLAP